MCNMCKTPWVVDTEWILRTCNVDEEWRSLSAAVVVVIPLVFANIIIGICVPLIPGPRGIPKETRIRGRLQPPPWSKLSLTSLAWIKWSHLGHPLGCSSCCAGEGNDYRWSSPIRGALVAPEGRQSPPVSLPTGGSAMRAKGALASRRDGQRRALFVNFGLH